MADRPGGAGGARIDDYAVDEKNPHTYFIGYAVSGIWRTMNNGTTFDSIFDTYGGGHDRRPRARAVDPNILYVGTGEANRQSASFGKGMFKSTERACASGPGEFERYRVAGDAADRAHHAFVHPTNPDIVWVARRDIYGPNPERGVFMTTDGGKTWNKTLFMAGALARTTSSSTRATR